MYVDIKLTNSSGSATVKRVSVTLQVNYSGDIERGAEVLPSNVVVYGNEALFVYDYITSVADNTQVEIFAQSPAGLIPILNGFTNINSDIQLNYYLNTLSFSVVTYDRAINMSFILNEKVLNIQRLISAKTITFSYNANKEVLGAIAFIGLASVAFEFIDIYTKLQEVVLKVTANPLSYDELLVIITIIIRLTALLVIVVQLIETILEAIIPVVLEVPCYNVKNVIEQVCSAYGYSVVWDSTVENKIKNLYYIEPYSVDSDKYNTRKLRQTVRNEDIIPSVTLLDLFELVKHYAFCFLQPHGKKIYVISYEAPSVTAFYTIKNCVLDTIEPNKIRNNLYVVNLAVDTANALSIAQQTSRKVFFNTELYTAYTTNTTLIKAIDNGTYAHNSVFSTTKLKKERKTFEKIYDGGIKMVNKIIDTLNGVIAGINAVVGAIVSTINKLINTINKLLKANLKPITVPKIATIPKYPLLQDFLGFLETEQPNFSTPILFAKESETDNIIKPQDTAGLLNTFDTKNAITKTLSIKIPMNIAEYLSFANYLYCSFNDEIWHIKEHSASVQTNGEFVVEAKLFRVSKIVEKLHEL